MYLELYPWKVLKWLIEICTLVTCLCFFRASTLCKRSKRLSWTRSINTNQISTKEKKRVRNRKLTLEIYSRFDFALLFPFSNARLFVRFFVRLLVHLFACLFVRFFFCSSLFVSSFTCLSFVFFLSSVLKTLRVFYAAPSQVLSDRLPMRKILKRLFFHFSGT